MPSCGNFHTLLWEENEVIAGQRDSIKLLSLKPSFCGTK